MSHAPNNCDAPSVEPSPEQQGQPRALARATGWPGLVFWLGPGVFRGLGYLALLLAGICMANKDPFWIFAVELLVGHLLICAAEVIGQMNDERERDSSANGPGQGRAQNGESSP